MAQKHQSRLLSDFPDATKFRTIHVLDIPDDYGYIEAELVQLVRIAADPIIDDSQAQRHTKS